MGLAQDISNWVARAEQRLSSFSVVERHYGETLLAFRLADTEVLRWVERFLTPLLDKEALCIDDPPFRPLHFDHLYDDALVAEATQILIAHDQCVIDENIGTRGGYRCGYREGKALVLDPHDGVVIHVDFTDRRFRFVHSSRTRWPSIQFGDLVYEPLLRSAQCSGGIPFHAGAVTTSGGAILVVGYRGEGKTTLVSGLMREGAAFIGNELSFVKRAESGFHVFLLAGLDPHWCGDSFAIPDHGQALTVSGRRQSSPATVQPPKSAGPGTETLAVSF